jgi:hypothetical protein
LNEIVRGDKKICDKSLSIWRNVFVCGPVLEGEYDRIKQNRDQAAIDTHHFEK